MSTASIIIWTGIFFYALTCLAMIDIAFKDFGSLPKKAAWGCVAFIPFIGCIIYFLFGYGRGKRKPKDPEENID